MRDFVASIINHSDAFASPFWLLANVVALVAAWKWARRLFPIDTCLELVTHTVVLFWASIVLVATALGAVNLLKGFFLLAGVGGLSLFALWAIRMLPADSNVRPVFRDRSDALWFTAWTALFSYWGAHVVLEGLLRFPADWDSLAYHLPLVDHWLQTQSLLNTDSGRWSNSGNNELLALWMVAPFSGDFLAAFNNLPIAILFASSGVVFGTRIGLPPGLANLGAMALVANLVVGRQLVNQENDVAVAACFFAALGYIFRCAESSDVSDGWLAAICLGLLAGVKFYALGYAALALALWIAWTAVKQGVRPGVRVLAVGAAGLIAFGGYWYIRNWLMTGSPLYPREFFKHPDVLVQIYPDVAHTSFFGNNRPELLELFIYAIWQMMGPCQLMGFLLTPLTFLGLAGVGAWSALRGRDQAQGRIRAALAIVLLGAGTLLGITPFAVEDDPGTLNQMHWHYCPVRYGLCFLSSATLAALVVARDLLFRIRPKPIDAHAVQTSQCRWRLIMTMRTVALMVISGAVFFQLARGDTLFSSDLMPKFLLAANLFLTGLIMILLQNLWPRFRLGLIFLAIGLALFPWACVRLAENWHRGFIPHYDRMHFGGELAKLAAEERASAAFCALDERYYPFFGSHRERRVCQPVHVVSPDWLMEYLDREDIAFVRAKLRVPRAGWQRHLGFDECLARYPERFRKISQSSGFIMVEVVPVFDRRAQRRKANSAR
jgi:hypothetical protein